MKWRQNSSVAGTTLLGHDGHPFFLFFFWGVLFGMRCTPSAHALSTMHSDVDLSSERKRGAANGTGRGKRGRNGRKTTVKRVRWQSGEEERKEEGKAGSPRYLNASRYAESTSSVAMYSGSPGPSLASNLAASWPTSPACVYWKSFRRRCAATYLKT